MGHKCDLANCDGTTLGHELARDFPQQTERVTNALRDLLESPEDRVMPENLQVDDT